MRNLIPSSDKSELGNIPFHATFAHSAQQTLELTGVFTTLYTQYYV